MTSVFEAEYSVDNKFRLALIYEREQAQAQTHAPEVCVKCAGWKHFGNKESSITIARFGPICCCNETWQRIQQILNTHKIK
jgi:hypothetical protein